MRGADGFTLIEVLIVVTIIGIIAGIAIPGLLNALDKSRQVSSAMTLRGFGSSLEVYNGDNGQYPNVATARDLIPELRPYSNSLKDRDEWRHEFGWARDDAGTEYTITCYGKDGAPGLFVTPETRYDFNLDIVYADGAFVAAVE